MAGKARNYLINDFEALEKTSGYHRLNRTGRGSKFLRGFEMSIAP